jgi:tetratricopeptide (TPR) repeat protein
MHDVVPSRRGTPPRDAAGRDTSWRRGAAQVTRWARSVVAQLDRVDALVVSTRAVDALRQVDRATGYRSAPIVKLHLAAIDDLFEAGCYDDALAAADDVLADCATRRRPHVDAASRAHGERARCLARLDRYDESIEEFTSSLDASVPASVRAVAWRLSLRYSLALTRRDVGELGASTAELRVLVPEMASVFGEHSSWLVSTVTELATNIALDGDVPTAIEMVSAELPGASYHRGPLSREALTLRSKIARWTLADGDGDDDGRGRRLAASAVVDFTRAGLSTCAEAFELRFLYADSLLEAGEVDYGIAQLSSLLDDLQDSRWAISDFAEAVTAQLEEWRDVQRGGATRE